MNRHTIRLQSKGTALHEYVVAPNTWRIATLGLTVTALGITFLGLLTQNDVTRGVYPAVAGFATIFILAAFGIPWLLQPMRIKFVSIAPWIIGLLSAVAITIPLLLWAVDRIGLGSQWMQSIRISAGPPAFGDIEIVRNWLTCASQGIDPFGGSFISCADVQMNYGPALLWLSLPELPTQITNILGFLAIGISSLTLVWLARASRGRGVFALLIVAVSPSWLLLLERGNIDQAIIWSALIAVFIVRWKPNLVGWAIAAIPIWILGSWKYYPFAMILAFLPALKLRRGWLIPSIFLFLAGLYLFLNQDLVRQSLASHSGLSGGIGRDTLIAFIQGTSIGVDSLWTSLVLVVLLCVTSLIWGITTAPYARRIIDTPEGLSYVAIATAGSTLIIGTLLLGGFGYVYKSAFLILAFPLLSRLGNGRYVTAWQSSTTILLLALLSMTVVSNPLLGSLSALVSGSFVLGLSVTLMIRYLRVPLTVSRINLADNPIPVRISPSDMDRSQS